jgi:hypothetical protein
MNRRELSVLYNQGALTYDQLKKRLQALGYPDDTVTATANALQQQKRLKLAKSDEAQSYLKGGTNEQGVRQGLQADGAEPSDADWIMQRLRRDFQFESTARKVAAVGKGFARGTLPLGQVANVLQGFGLDLDQVTQYQQIWSAELATVEKQAQAAELVKWYETGLMPQQQLVDALTNLMYRPEDVAFIVAMANATIAKQLATQVEKLTKEQQAAQKQAEAQAAKARAALEKATKAAERLRVAASRVAVGLQNIDGITQQQAYDEVNAALAAYKRVPNTSDAGAVSFIKGAYEAHKAKGGPSFVDAVNSLLHDLLGT